MEINTHASSNISNMILFEKIKTGNPIIDTIVLTFLLTSINYIFKWFNNNVLEDLDISVFNLKYILHYFTKKNVVEYEGKISSSTNFYDSKINRTSAFSDRFKALWYHIIDNITFTFVR